MISCLGVCTLQKVKYWNEGSCVSNRFFLAYRRAKIFKGCCEVGTSRYPRYKAYIDGVQANKPWLSSKGKDGLIFGKKVGSHLLLSPQSKKY